MERNRGFSHFGNPCPDIHLSLYSQIVECLVPKLVLPQRSLAPCNRTWSGTMAEYSVDAAFAHLMVTLGVDHEAHVLIEVS